MTSFLPFPHGKSKIIPKVWSCNQFCFDYVKFVHSCKKYSICTLIAPTLPNFLSHTLYLIWIVLQPSMELWLSRSNPFRQLEATSSWFFFLILWTAIWQQESTQQSIWKTCHAWENIKEKIWKQEILPLLIPLHKKVACHLCQSISHCTSLLCVISILCLSLAYQAKLCQGSSLFGCLLDKNVFSI